MKQSEKKFLVVEDVEDVAKNNCTFLHLIDPLATCEIISNPTAAKHSLTRNLPDLLVVDLVFEEEAISQQSSSQKNSGIAFLQYVLRSHPQLNVLVYSTNPELVNHLSIDIKEHEGGFSIVDKMELRAAFLAGANAALLGEKRICIDFPQQTY